MTPAFTRSIAALVLAAAALFFTSSADARNRYYDDEDDRVIEPLPSRTPLFAVVGLKEQRVSIYDAKGKFLESPVSSGQNGLETPAGIYSIVQKEEDHHSNIYDDASMPFMERITWTGIALHAGVLPGYPASHGCVRMPEDFAERLYDITNLGMRVIVVREDIAPAEVPQPAMFTADAAPAGRDTLSRVRGALRTAFMDLENAKRRDREAKSSADLERAESELRAAGHAAETANGGKAAEAGAAKPEAEAKLANAQAQLQAAKAEAEAKAEAVRQAADDMRAASVALAKAADAYEAAELNLNPVSVFISRKTQRLYIRKNNMPVYESPVTMRDAGRPIGSYVFTAVDYTDKPGIMRWMLVSMYKDAARVEAEPQVSPVSAKVRNKPSLYSEPYPSNVTGAAEALNRIEIPAEAQAKISAAVLPGSSLIISDEGLSGETGKDTDFVVVMSGEPQGGLSIRHHPKKERDEFAGDNWFTDHSSRSGRRSGGFFYFSE
jgi:hypothetical protein